VPSKEELKTKVCREIYHRSKEIIGTGQTILGNPEMDFRRLQTPHLVFQKFLELRITYPSHILDDRQRRVLEKTRASASSNLT